MPDQWKKHRGKLVCCALLALAILFTGGCSVFPGRLGPTRDHGAEMATRQISPAELNGFIQTLKPVYGEADSHHRLGRYFQKQGRHDIAIDEFLKALAVDPERAETFNALGVSYDCRGQFALARASYKSALALAPETAYILNNMGHSYFLSGDMDAAVDAFKDAFTLKPGNTKFRNNLGRAIRYKIRQAQSKKPRQLKSASLTPLIKSNTPDKDTGPAIASASSISEKYAAGSAFPSLSATPEINTHSRHNTKITPFLSLSPTPVKTTNHPNHNGVPPFSSRLSTAGVPPTINDNAHAMQIVEANLFPVPQYPDPHIVLTAACNAPMDASAPEIKKDLLFSIEVSNGNGIRHMARDVGRCMRKKGFKIKRLTNASHFNFPRTIIMYTPGNYDYAARIALEFPGIDKKNNLIQERGLKKDVTILLGKDLIPFRSSIRKGKLTVQLQNATAPRSASCACLTAPRS